MKTIKTVGVVGAGTMGSALAQKFAQEGFRVILADREMAYVNKGIAGIREMLAEGMKRRLFTEERVNTILENIHGTEHLEDLSECDITVEAIFEDFKAKTELFSELGKILSDEAVLATNTSSFSVTELANSYSHPENFIGLHYFYHAAKNRLLEIIPGDKTSGETLKTAEVFAALTGKDAIFCKDSYGFAVNRFFVPWLNEAVRLLQEDITTAAGIDRVCMKTFGIGMGPFALMNATGVPIAYHSQKTLEVFGSFYQVAPLLEQQAQSNQPWKIEAAEENQMDEKVETLIRERMLGTVFLVCSQILDEKVCSATELNRGARIGLRWRKGPVELMKASGEEEVGRMVRKISEKYNLPFPSSLGASQWEMEFVKLEFTDGIATITISRPEDLNALNETVVTQLSEKFSEAENNPDIQTIIITGSGKAFVAGADIKFFVKNIKRGSLNNILDFTRFGQEVFQRIDHSSKKVVAILNGLALGGGLELALCADVILAVPEAVMAFPETGIGIYPGLGGTQRTPKRIGKGLAKYLIFTGKMLPAKEAEKIGLVDALERREDIFELKTGNKPIPGAVGTPKPLEVNWQAMEDFFEQNSLEQILEGNIAGSQLPADEIAKLRKTIKYKAPVALKIAEKLMDEAKGVSAELEEIGTIFSTEDALLGLSSIGKKVEYQGR